MTDASLFCGGCGRHLPCRHCTNGGTAMTDNQLDAIENEHRRDCAEVPALVAEVRRLRDGIDRHQQTVIDASVLHWREPQDLLDVAGDADLALWSLLDPEVQP